VKINKAGDQLLLPASASLAERNALAAELIALRKAGHAVQCDEVIESGERTGEIRAWHYRTCLACIGAR
jgi:hypothetical protein